MKRVRIFLIAAILLVVALYRSDQAAACGPFFELMIMNLTQRPDAPLDRYARGELGVIQPNFWRIYLVPAYRNLTGRGYDAEERKALLKIWGDAPQPTPSTAPQSAQEEWARKAEQVAGSPLLGSRSAQTRTFSGKGLYGEYLNCPDDSFRTASQALQERVQKYGAGNTTVKDWIIAQDKVFANCHSGRSIPEEFASGDAMAIADRNYQIAAAHFYAEEFDEAATRFDAIGKDAASPWSKMAPYLAARALVRKGTLGAEYGKILEAPMAEAEQRLNSILSDSSRSDIHPACERLLDFIRYRLHPEEELKILEARLLKKGAAEALDPGLMDYTNLLIRHKPEHPSDLADWVLNARASGQQATDHAIARWKETSSEAWLVAALMKIRADHPQRAALTEAAEKVRANSPAFVSVSYHRLRLEVESGEADRARKDLDDFLAKHQTTLRLSSRNQLLDLRLKVARDLNEFMKYSRREPAGYTYDSDREAPLWFESEDAKKKSAERLTISPWAAEAFNKRMPVALLARAATTAELAPRIQLDLAQASWTRAALLGNPEAAGQVQPLLIRHVPALKPLLAAVGAAKDGEERKFAQAFLMLKTPGMRPPVSSRYYRRASLGVMDMFRENWWCASREDSTVSAPFFYSQGGVSEDRNPRDSEAGADIPISFLTEADRKAAREEWKHIAGAGTAPNFLAKQVLAWAEKHADDPRVPEALHLVVRATRLGCTDSETSRYSKAAFQSLHGHYPQSEWAKKTKYWY